MKFTVEKNLLLSAITTSSRASATKSAVPALEGLLIEALESGVRISGYDLKTGIVTSFPAEVVQPGSIVLSARLFGEIVRKLPDDIITISSDDRPDDKNRVSHERVCHTRHVFSGLSGPADGGLSKDVDSDGEKPQEHDLPDEFCRQRQ